MNISRESSCPKPGEILIVDCRSAANKSKVQISLNHDKKEIKCIQWNIERGYKLDDIIRILKNEEDASIICLQELDISCERSGNRNCASELAEALGMKCAFMAEFEEIHSHLRTPDLQGGGVHGNAILSKFDFDPYIVKHTHHPYNWEADGHILLEPRKGERAIVAADIIVPWMPSPIVCYSLHLEVFCGITGRMKQFADVLEDSNSRIRKHRSHYQLIMGDLNTMAHGIARFSPKYCKDALRFISLGYSEGQWWQKYLFNIINHSIDDSENHLLAKRFKSYFTQRELINLRNNYFFDPFNIDNDTTLSNYGGWFTGKLDWLLVRGFEVTSKGMGNLDYAASDHRLLRVTLRPLEDANISNVAKSSFELNKAKAAETPQASFIRRLGTLGTLVTVLSWMLSRYVLIKK